MTIELNCSHCDGVASFRAERRGSSGRLIGTCGGCGSTFSLYGGRMTTLDQRTVDELGPRWAFSALVQADRQARRATADGPDPTLA